MSNDEPDSTSADTAAATPPRRRKGLEGRVIGGRYEVTRTVAAGANTLIAAAKDIELNRLVTVKLVRPELSESETFRRHFRKEMEMIVGVSHPNIGAIYDWGEEQIGKRATVYAVGEYLTGGSLRDLFDRGRYLAPSQALMVGLEACRGLDFAHQNGLVHTELTPSKLVFGDDRRLRIVDFGLARILGEQEWRDPSRVATHVARYASPEQAQGLEVEGKTDVYSLALILIEAVTGSVPFTADSTVSTLAARVGKLMRVDADLGPLASVLERAGRPEAAERWTAAQFGRALVQTAPKMSRPTPIPTLTTNMFVDDPNLMRRPNDPTGGIERPAADPEPMFVTPSPTAIQPGDDTVEITNPDVLAPLARNRPDVAAAPAADAGAAETSTTSGDTEVADAPPLVAARGAGVTPDAPAAAGTAEFDDLAALVGHTPRRPPRTGQDDQSTDESTGKVSRKERRARRKADKHTDTTDGDASAGSESDGSPPNRPTLSRGDATASVPPNEQPVKRRRWAPWLVGVFMLAMLAGLGAIAWTLFRSPTHPVPDVVGLDRDAALPLVDDFEWDISFDEVRSDEFPTPGDVVRTAPSAGQDLAEGSPLLIFVSEGPEFRQVPDLAGLSLEDAQAKIDELRLTANEPSRQFSETVASGIVISSSSAEGVPIGGDVLPGSAMSMVVSAGPQRRTVPQLRGLSVADATQVLTDVGLTAVVGDPVFDTDISVDAVSVQAPAVGQSVARGGTVTLQPSKGPDFVTMPDLTGTSLPQAQLLLQQAGLQPGPVLGSTTGTFYAASIDDTQVETGDQVVRGSIVNLIVL